jgi:hypothetical protein
MLTESVSLLSAVGPKQLEDMATAPGGATNSIAGSRKKEPPLRGPRRRSPRLGAHRFARRNLQSE